MSRIVVKVLPGPPRSRTVGQPPREEHMPSWVAVCQTVDWTTGRLAACPWQGYSNVAKTDVEQHARWHREEHRRQAAFDKDCRQLAETSTRHGTFRNPTGLVAWVPCPTCRHHVAASFPAAAKPREIERLIVDAVEEHLHNRDECTGWSG